MGIAAASLTPAGPSSAIVKTKPRYSPPAWTQADFAAAHRSAVSRWWDVLGRIDALFRIGASDADPLLQKVVVAFALALDEAWAPQALAAMAATLLDQVIGALDRALTDPTARLTLAELRLIMLVIVLRHLHAGPSSVLPQAWLDRVESAAHERLSDRVDPLSPPDLAIVHSVLAHGCACSMAATELTHAGLVRPSVTLNAPGTALTAASTVHETILRVFHPSAASTPWNGSRRSPRAFVPDLRIR